MTLVGRLLEQRNLEDPQIPISATDILAKLGFEKTYAGEHVSEQKVLGIPAFMRGARIISGTEAGLPLKVYASREDRTEVDVPWRGVSPTTGATWFERRETATLHKVLWGEAFWYKVRENGRIVDTFPIHPSRVRIDTVALGREKIRYYKVYVVDGVTPLTDFEILHVPGPSTDGIRGISMISAHRQSLGIAIAAERTAATLYGQGMFHQGFITHDKPINDEAAKQAKSRWAEMVGRGAQTAGDIVVLGNGGKFQSITMPPGDAQFLESRQFTVSEVARMLGLPPWMLIADSSTSRWGTGMEQEFTAWVMLSVKPEAQRDEQRITSELCTGDQVAEFVLEGLLRGDSASRATFYASGIQHGWLVPNDIRRKENMEPVPWGDEPYRPFTGTGSGDGSTLDAAAIAARNLVEMVQKVYLGVGVVITEDEARELLNQAGANLAGPGPSSAPSSTGGAAS